MRSPEPLLLTYPTGSLGPVPDRMSMERPCRISTSPAARGGPLSPPILRTASRSRSPSPLAMRNRSLTPSGLIGVTAAAEDIDATLHSENLARRVYSVARLMLRLLVVLSPDENVGPDDAAADKAAEALPGADVLSCLQRQVCIVAHDLWRSASLRSSSSSLAWCVPRSFFSLPRASYD
jgi:hypothetical protein